MKPVKRSTNTKRDDLSPLFSSFAALRIFLIRISRMRERINSKGSKCHNFSKTERGPSPVASAQTAQISSGKRGIKITPTITHLERSLLLLLLTPHACATTKETVINRRNPQKMRK